MTKPFADSLSARIAAHRERLIGEHYSPLLPFTPPANAKLCDRDAERFAMATARADAWARDMIASAGALAPYLDYNWRDVRRLAQSLPRELRSEAATLEGLVTAAERRFGPVQGKTLEARAARVADPAYWTKALKRGLLRSRETLWLRLRAIGGKTGEHRYASPEAVTTKRTQLQGQARWLAETAVQVPNSSGEIVSVPLAAVASTPHRRLARLGTWVGAMDKLAIEAQLSVAMLTLTLEPEWHPNPTRGECSWNGSTPEKGQKEMARRFQVLRKRLDKRGVKLAGFRVVEPHKDACVHWHAWLIFRTDGLEILKRELDKLWPIRNAYKLEMVDRSRGSGATYAQKYLGKTLGVDSDDKKGATALQVAAHRQAWGVRSFQCFGVGGSLSAWDELRRLGDPPADPQLMQLWAAARAGDAIGYIRACGGLACAPTATKDRARPRLAYQHRMNRYGETTRKVVGVAFEGATVPTRRPVFGFVRLLPAAAACAKAQMGGDSYTNISKGLGDARLTKGHNLYYPQMHATQGSEGRRSRLLQRSLVRRPCIQARPRIPVQDDTLGGQCPTSSTWGTRRSYATRVANGDSRDNAVFPSSRSANGSVRVSRYSRMTWIASSKY